MGGLAGAGVCAAIVFVVLGGVVGDASSTPEGAGPLGTSAPDASAAEAAAGEPADVQGAIEEAAEPAPAGHPVDRSSVGQPWGEVDGLTMFRGNPTRTYYGKGPLPRSPEVLWTYPATAMCSTEQLAGDETRSWCGTGWTGQPLVWNRPDGVTELAFGAYDHQVHFLDAASGEPTRRTFLAGHMVKGSETLDPDGYPLLYTGARDGKLRILALDRTAPTELWALSAHPQRVWNDDWDGNPAIVDDLMYVGGEDSWFFVVRLNRGYDDAGAVTVDPEVIFEMPGFDQELFANVGDRNVSIDSSVALYEGRAYFANSAGRVVGLDVSELATSGEAPVVFDFWTGDDTDATITIDGEGMLYVAVELERFLPRAEEVGQLVKLDPYREGDPIVWSVDVPPAAPGVDGGIWATPALHEDMLYVPTHAGELLGVDTGDGEVFFRERIGYHEWGSPAVVDDTLVVPLCEQGGVRAYDLSDPRRPQERWTVQLGGCVESTPAVWEGRIYVGSRDGKFYALGDP